MHKKGYKNRFISPNESVLDQKHKLKNSQPDLNSEALMASLVNGAEQLKQFYFRKHLCLFDLILYVPSTIFQL